MLCMCASLSVFSQEKEDVASSGIWDNWYLEAGMDMSLQNPYGCNFSAVFPNGKTFGIDVAAGKWFTPFFGLRGKLNWENGIRLLETLPIDPVLSQEADAGKIEFNEGTQMESILSVLGDLGLKAE